MLKHLKKTAVAAAIAISFSTGAFAQAYITAGLLGADVNASGTFKTLSYSGTEFLDHGTPMSYYWLNSSQAGSPFIANNASSTNPLGATTVGLGTISFSAASGSLVFNQTISLIGNAAVVNVSLTNTSLAAITGVQWGVGIDPDQGMDEASTATFNTVNSILGQGSAAAAQALDPNSPFYGITLRNTTSASAFDIWAYIDSTCCSPVDPASVLGNPAQAVGSYGTNDHSINLAYGIGTIGAGQSVSFGYEYVFSAAPIPEPEIYAMLAAGLGLMGFVARRRQRNGAVA